MGWKLSDLRPDLQARISASDTSRAGSFSESEERMLRLFYSQPAVDIDKIAEAMHRSRWSIVNKAVRMGITNANRSKTDEHAAASTETRKIQWSTKTAQERSDSTSHLLEFSGQNKGNKNGRASNWKAQWAEIGGCRFFARSSWEVNYARFLEWRKQIGEINLWEYEPVTFWFEKVKRGCVSYKPDFRVTLKDGSIEFHEVKGWMDKRSKTVLRRMKIYHPDVIVVLIDSERYKSIMKTCGSMLPKIEQIQSAVR